MKYILYIILIITVTSCSVSKSSFSPNKKYSPEQLQKDYHIYQTILEQSHPGLYWYTSKDSMDHYFKEGAAQLKDSLTELQFRKIITYVTAKIDCGHTSVRSSKSYAKFLDTTRLKIFPLSLKIWPDTAAVASALIRRDSIFKRGTIINKINGRPMNAIVDTLFNYLSTDGYNRTHKYQTLSNRGNFGTMYTFVFGLSDRYTIEYTDSTGQTKTATVPIYIPAADTAMRRAIRSITTIPQPKKPSRKERKKQQISVARQLRIDSVNHTAFMDLNTFGRGYQLKKFFRSSFKALHYHKISHLIIDVRSNGGGSVSNSTFISRYLADHPFKIADSLYALRKKSTYGKYIADDFWNRLFMSFFARHRRDGHYHFGYFERHYFKPKTHNHFDGKTYILIGGNSFSATTLFTSAVIKQDNVTVVGEETGGGAYGNTAWLIPDVTLPVTHIRFRLPLFRLVMDKNNPKTGKGVQPEVESKPTIDAIRRGADFKLDAVMELIKKDKTPPDRP